MIGAHLRNISLSRPITSYAKVQEWIGNVIRNRKFQLRRERVRNLRYLDLGCGRNTHENFINLDCLWHPSVDVCWDITRGLPFPNASMKGIFTEHCLEHFPLTVGMQILRELRRLLEPGGVIRIVVPNGQMYLEIYAQQTLGKSEIRFPFQELESFQNLYSPILSVNRVFYQDRESPFGHRAMFDSDLLGKLLALAGFVNIGQTCFYKSRDDCLAIDTPSRSCESLYMEASVP